MCTVTYTPLKQSVLIASCRDEKPNRIPAAIPASFKGTNHQFLFPQDGHAGGTWIGVNNTGHLLILLNGGFRNHEKKTSYRLSRGLIMKQLLDSKTPVASWKELDLQNIEPFTVIVYTPHMLHQLVWTGDYKSHTYPDPSIPHIWSSATLYGPAIRASRKQWYEAFLQQNPQPSSNELLRFFVTDSPRDKENGFIMNRNELIKTCSISLVEMKEHHAIFEYIDLLSREKANTRTWFYFDDKPGHRLHSIKDSESLTLSNNSPSLSILSE